jgi:hypothetical protein
MPRAGGRTELLMGTEFFWCDDQIPEVGSGNVSVLHALNYTFGNG